MEQQHNAKDELLNLIREFITMSEENDNIIKWINPIVRNSSNDGIEDTKYELSYIHDGVFTLKEELKKEQGGQSEESEGFNDIVIYYESTKLCYVIGKIVPSDSVESKARVQPYFSLNEDKIYYKNGDVILYNIDSGSGKYEVNDKEENIILKKVNEDIFRSNYAIISDKSSESGSEEIEKDKKNETFPKMVEYWINENTIEIEKDNIINYDDVYAYFVRKKQLHDSSLIESSNYDNIDRKSNIYTKYIDLRLTILELFKNYILELDNEIDDDNEDILDNAGVIKLYNIIDCKKNIYDLFKLIKEKRIKEEEEEKKRIKEEEEEKKRAEEEKRRIEREEEIAERQRKLKFLKLKQQAEERGIIEAEKRRLEEERQKERERIEEEEKRRIKEKQKENFSIYKKIKNEQSLEQNYINYAIDAYNKWIKLIEEIIIIYTSQNPQENIIGIHRENITLLKKISKKEKYIFTIIINGESEYIYEIEDGRYIIKRQTTEEIIEDKHKKDLIENFKIGTWINEDLPTDPIDKLFQGSTLELLIKQEKIKKIEIDKLRKEMISNLYDSIIKYFENIGFIIISNIYQTQGENILQNLSDLYENIIEPPDLSRDKALDDIKKEINFNININNKISGIDLYLGGLITDKKYLQALNLISIVFYVFCRGDVNKYDKFNTHQGTICSLMKINFETYQTRELNLSKKVIEMFTFFDKKIADIIPYPGDVETEYLFNKQILDEIIKEKNDIIFKKEIDEKINDDSFNKICINFIKAYKGLSIYNNYSEKLLKTDNPKLSIQPCSDIEFYGNMIENFSDEDLNNDNLFNKLSGNSGYGTIMKEKCNNIINFKITNKKELPYNFSYKEGDNIYKYISLHDGSYYFYKLKQNIYFDIQNTVQIKIGIQVGDTLYYSKEEISISLYDLIDYLSEDNSIMGEKFNPEEKYEDIALRESINDSYNYIFKFVGFEPSKILNYYLRNDKTELNSENSDEIIIFFKLIKKNKYHEILNDIKNGSSDKKNERIGYLKRELKSRLGESIKNIDLLDTCELINEYLLNLHWNLLIVKSSIITPTEILPRAEGDKDGNGYRIDFFDNKTDTLGIPNLIYSDIYKVYFVNTKLEEQDKIATIKKNLDTIKQYLESFYSEFKSVIDYILTDEGYTQYSDGKKYNSDIIADSIMIKSIKYIKYVDSDPPIIEGDFPLDSTSINLSDLTIDEFNYLNLLMYSGNIIDKKLARLYLLFDKYGDLNNRIDLLYEFYSKIKTDISFKKIELNEKTIEIVSIEYVRTILKNVLDILSKKKLGLETAQAEKRQQLENEGRINMLKNETMLSEINSKTDTEVCKITDIDKYWYFPEDVSHDMKSGNCTIKNVSDVIKTMIDNNEESFQNRLCKKFGEVKKESTLNASSDESAPDESLNDIFKLTDKIKSDVIDTTEKEIGMINIWNNNFPYNLKNDSKGFTKWRTDSGTIYINFDEMDNVYIIGINNYKKIKSYNLGYVLGDDNNKYSYCEIEKEKTDKSSKYSIILDKSTEKEKCNLHTSSIPCEEVTIENSIFNINLKNIYHFACYLLKLENVYEYNLYFAYKSTENNGHLYLLKKNGDDNIIIKEVGNETELYEGKNNYFIYNELLYNYKIEDGIIDLIKLKICTKLLLFPSNYDGERIIIFPELLPGYFQILDYYSKTQLKYIYNKLVPIIKNLLTVDTRESVISDLNITDGKKIRWSDLTDKFKTVEDYINWSTTAQNSDEFTKVIVNTNENIIYLTQIYENYKNNYSKLKNMALIFEYYKSNIDEIHRILIQNNEIIMNKITNEVKYDIKEEKERLVAINLEIKETSDEIKNLQKRFNQKIDPSENPDVSSTLPHEEWHIPLILKNCIIKSLQSEISSLQDIESILKNSISIVDAREKLIGVSEDYSSLIDLVQDSLSINIKQIDKHKTELREQDLITSESFHLSRSLLDGIYDLLKLIISQFKPGGLDEKDIKDLESTPDIFEKTIKIIKIIDKFIKSGEIQTKFMKLKTELMELLISINQVIVEIDNKNDDLIRKNNIIILTMNKKMKIMKQKIQKKSIINIDLYNEYRKTDEYKIPIQSREDNKLIRKFKIDNSNLQLNIKNKNTSLKHQIETIMHQWNKIIIEHENDNNERKLFKEKICEYVNSITKLGTGVTSDIVYIVEENNCLPE